MTTPPDVKTLVVAIAGGTSEERRQLNNRIAMERRPRGPSTFYVDIEGRFKREREWRDHLRSLPSSRPADLFVRFTMDGVATELQQGAYQACSPSQLYVEKVFRYYGIPGEWSHVGIVHESVGRTRIEVVETVQAIASRRIAISD